MDAEEIFTYDELWIIFDKWGYPYDLDFFEILYTHEGRWEFINTKYMNFFINPN